MTAQQASADPAETMPDRTILAIVAVYAAAFVLFGLMLQPPAALLAGLGDILTTRDALLTDYFGVGGIGGGCVNAGLLTLAAAFVYWRTGARITGASVAALFLVLGFGLFGKKLVNVWAIILVFLASISMRGSGGSRSRRMSTPPFSAPRSPRSFPRSCSARRFPSPSACRSLWRPASRSDSSSRLPPRISSRRIWASASTIWGSRAGIVGTLIVALYKSYGFVPDPVFIWTTGHNVLLGTFLAIVFFSMLYAGWRLEPDALQGLRRILREPGRAPSDFIAIAGFGPTLANMGLTGFVGVIYVLAVGGDLNGPVIGAILTIVGFSAYGKHPRNIIPIMLGVFVGSLVKPWGAADPSATLAALFGTTLAPIAGRFGWQWGVVAGFVHSSAAMSVGPLHAGLNLYNNGFAAGIVASVLVPVILAVRAGFGYDDGDVNA